MIFPKHKIIESNHIAISLNEPEGELYGELVVIGLEEPSENVCWIETPVEKGWKWLLEACEQLLLAGYPGCLGCGGANSEMLWNEKSFREVRKN